MSILSFLGGASAKTISDPINAIGNVFDGLFTSDEERLKAEFVMEKLKQQPHLLQAEMTKVEAQHRSTFVAGWRPFLGWICGVGLAFSFVGNPIIQWVTCIIGDKCISGPVMPLEHIMTLVTALLGLGGLRTIEKLNGISK